VTLCRNSAELERGLTSSVVFTRSMQFTWPTLMSYVEFVLFWSFLEVIRIITPCKTTGGTAKTTINDWLVVAITLIYQLVGKITFINGFVLKFTLTDGVVVKMGWW